MGINLGSHSPITILLTTSNLMLYLLQSLGLLGGNHHQNDCQSPSKQPMDTQQQGIFDKKISTYSLQILRGFTQKKHRSKKFVKKASIWIIHTLSLTVYVGVFSYMYGMKLFCTYTWHCSHLRFWACAIYNNPNLSFISIFHCTSNQEDGHFCITKHIKNIY